MGTEEAQEVAAEPVEPIERFKWSPALPRIFKQEEAQEVAAEPVERFKWRPALPQRSAGLSELDESELTSRLRKWLPKQPVCTGDFQKSVAELDAWLTMRGYE